MKQIVARYIQQLDLFAVKCSKKLRLAKLTLADSAQSSRDGSEQCESSPVKAPTYRPGAEQFDDALSYIESIRAQAEPYGMCCVVPPPNWKVRKRLFCVCNEWLLHVRT